MFSTSTWLFTFSSVVKEVRFLALTYVGIGKTTCAAGPSFNLLVPTYLSILINQVAQFFKWVRSGTSLAYPYCRRLPWERAGRRCSFLLAWDIGGTSLGQWWETHLFPLLSLRISFSDTPPNKKQMISTIRNPKS